MKSLFTRLIKTKTFWVGLAAIASGIGLCTNGDYTAGVQTILGGVATITLRDTLAKQDSTV